MKHDPDYSPGLSELEYFTPQDPYASDPPWDMSAAVPLDQWLSMNWDKIITANRKIK